MTRLEALLARASGHGISIPDADESDYTRPMSDESDYTRPLSDEGPLDARIIVLGESPGYEEMRVRRNFVGKSGQKLRTHMRLAGIHPEKCRIENVVPFYPDGGSIDKLDPTIVRQWQENTLERLRACRQAVVIVCIGNVALETCTGLRDISRRRGSVYEWEGRKVIGMIHPTAILHSRGGGGGHYYEKMCRLDWERVKMLSTPHTTHHAYCGCASRIQRSHVTPFSVSPNALQSWWRRFREMADDPMQVLAIDIETPKVQGKRRIVCVSFAFTADRSLVLPFDEVHKPLIASLCHAPCIKVGHNFVSFDRWWLEREDVHVAGEIRDTMCLQHCLDPASPHSLEFLASRYTFEPWWKDEGKGHDITLIEKDQAGYYAYSGLDSAVTIELHNLLWPELERRGMLDFYRRHYAALYDPILDVMLRGVEIDHPYRVQVLEELLVEAKRCRDRLGEINGSPLWSLNTQRDQAIYTAVEKGEHLDRWTQDEIDVTLQRVAKKTVSSAQLKTLLYEKLGLPLQTRRRKGSTETPTADTVALRTLRLQYVKSTDIAASVITTVLDLAMRHNSVQKLATFFYPNRYDPHDGRFRFTLKLNTEAARLASAAAPDGIGANSQNISRDKRARRVMVPDTGDVIVEADCCLTGETQIETPYGACAIQYIVEGDLVFSWRDGRVVVGDVTAKKRIGEFPVMRLILDNGEEVVGTAEHKFPVRKSHGRWKVKGEKDSFIEFVELQDLQPGDSLLPFRRAIDWNGREVVYSRSAFEYTRTHQAVAEHVYGQRPDGYDVHHIDGDYLNNHPSNLEYKESHAHKSEHAKANWETADAATKATWLARLARMRDRFIDHRGEKNPRYGYKGGVERQCLVCEKLFYKSPGRGQKYCSMICRDLRPRASKLEARKCLVCGHEFFKYPSEPQKFCSRECVKRSKVLNHKVVCVEHCLMTQPVYSITVEPDHNYALSAGVFTKNSQVEGRIVFVRTKDPELIRLARDRYADQHSYTASIITGKPEVLVGKGTEERQTAKSVNHAAQRDMHGKTMADYMLKQNIVHVDGTPYEEEECDAVLDIYHKKLPGIRLWQQRMRQEVRAKKRLVNRWGRIWDVRYEELNDDLYRKAYNFLPQSECADLTNQCFAALYKWLKAEHMHSRILMQEHDSLVISCAVSEAYDVAVFLRDHLEVELDYDGVNLSVPVEFKVGKNWGDCVEIGALPDRETFEKIIKNL